MLHSIIHACLAQTNDPYCAELRAFEVCYAASCMHAFKHLFRHDLPCCAELRTFESCCMASFMRISKSLSKHLTPATPRACLKALKDPRPIISTPSALKDVFSACTQNPAFAMSNADVSSLLCGVLISINAKCVDCCERIIHTYIVLLSSS